jgi:hypothetical protein
MYPSIPKGMSIGSFRAHPLVSLLRAAASRHGDALPTKAELDALKLPSAERAAVAKGAKEVQALFLDGDQQPARDRADEIAGKVIGRLGGEYLDPNYLEDRHRNDGSGLGPAALAALVKGEVV